MEPKPVITYFGDKELIGSVLQKKLQPRFKALQQSSLPKDDPPCSAFSSICNGVEFAPLSTVQARAKASPLPLYQRPALHTFWASSSDIDSYRTHDKPLITQWLRELEQPADGAERLIVYCITAEVRAKRHRTMSTITGSIEEKIRGDFRGKADDVFLLRLASSDENRVIESFIAFTARANQMCLAKFRKDIEKEAESVVIRREKRTEPKDFYEIFLQKLNLAVAYELTLSHEEALQLYSEASSDLEESLAMYGGSESPPAWLEAIRNAPCTTWDYPKLVWSHLAWRYLPAIMAGSSPLLHTQTFLLMRLCHLLFLLERGWTVSELCISTLHCMARQITALKLFLPQGAFDCWAYMTCQEAVLAIMARISADSVVSATSSLLLVRAELWHYALKKLHAIGILCELMPSCNVQNHDIELIKRITAGITPVPFEVDPRDPMEDEGKKLIGILNSAPAFRTAYLTLGEMVVGAFKHAGRRRMAFWVGTMMAQFDRDMGLVHEAEQLLSDICRFYSEDHWVQLSTKAYSLLADCQKKLKMEDKHVNTMLLLASFPPYPGASHDPNLWLDNLMEIAKRSHYQKLLAWDPLLELSAIRPVGGVGRSHSTGDTIRVELVIRYHGPKAMKPIFASLLLRAPDENKKNSPNKPLEKAPSSPTLFPVAMDNLEELDLGSDSPRLPHSRPIGMQSKTRSSGVVTVISSADLADSELGGAREDRRSKVPEFMLTVQSMELTPGENRFIVEGKTNTPGRYHPHKVNLKCGALDFLITVPEEPKLRPSVVVLPSWVDVGVSLEPELGEFLSGYPLECVLKLKTGRDTNVPEGAGIRVLTSNVLQCTVQDSTIHVNRVAGTSEASFKLPAIPEDSEHCTPLTLTIPSTQLTPRQGSQQTSTSSLDVAESCDSCAWVHEFKVFCDWLSPVHTAVLSLTVYDPLTVTHKEHTAGENTFLQLFVSNSSLLPIFLGKSMLAADLELARLHSELPEVLHPGETYSCVWKVTPGPPTVGEMMPASFHVHFRPLMGGKETPSEEMKKFQYDFLLSSMRTIYEVRASLEPMKEHSRVTTKRTAFLKFDIKNVTKNRFTTKLRYDVTADSKIWNLQDRPWGVIEVPKPGQQTQLSIKAMPLVVGLVELPTLTLSQYLADINPKGTGSPGKELNTSDGRCIPLSNAQLYNLSLGEAVSIATVQFTS